MKLMPSLSLAAATLSLGIVASPASAALVTLSLTFTYNSGAFTASSGTGSFTIDDSLLAPDVFTDDLNDLQDFSATFTDLAATPTTTSFALSDLSGWLFETDASANIFDVNFFMEGSTNADGYGIEGVEVLFLELYGNGQTTLYDTTVAAVPEPLTILGTATAIGFGAFFKRKLKGKQDSDQA